MPMKSPVPSETDLNRREFLTATAMAGAGLLVAPSALADPAAAPALAGRRKRYTLVGVGSRSQMYREAVLRTYAANCEMVGLCDLNLGRLQLAQARARAMANVEVPIFEAKDLDRMI